MSLNKYIRPTSYARRVRRLAVSTRDTLRSKRDLSRFAKTFPDVKNWGRLTSAACDDLLPYYHEYVSSVSTPIMAVSLELAAFLQVLCQVAHPTRILDLGTGFSSFVFRRFALSAPTATTVWSVDDSADWLNKTRAFLEAQSLPATNMHSWSSFCEMDEEPFDLILHDLGRMPTRQSALPTVLSFGAPGTMVVLDDVHKLEYAEYASRLLAESHLSKINLRTVTYDSFTRYAWLTVL